MVTFHPFAFRATPLAPAHAATPGTPVHFGAADDFCRSPLDKLEILYGPGIDPARYPDYTPQNIRLLLRQAHHMAQGGDFGAVVVAQDGLKRGIPSGYRRGLIGKEVNYGFSEHRTICAEQSAMKKVITAYRQHHGEKPRLEALFLSARDPMDSRIHTVAPCSFCLDAMHTEEAMDPDTLLISTARKPDQPDEYVITVRRLAEYLPFKTEPPQPSATRQPIHGLPVEFSEAARKSLIRQGLGIREFKKRYVPELMDNAEGVYRLAKRHLLAERNGKYLGAAALFIRNKEARYITTGASLVATDRNTQPADIKAIHDGLEGDVEWLVNNSEHGIPTREDLTMVAYYSEEVDQPINQASLGMMNILSRRSDILLAIIRDGRILVRTLDEYQPIRYTKMRDLSKAEPVFTRIRGWRQIG